MSLNYLDFEQPIAELEAKIDSLTSIGRQDDKHVNLDEEVQRLREKSVELTRKSSPIWAHGKSLSWRVILCVLTPLTTCATPSTISMSWRATVLMPMTKRLWAGLHVLMDVR